MSAPLINEKLNTETARIAWSELQPHFARGAAVYVAPDLDLIEIARYVADDAAAKLQPLMAAGKFGVIAKTKRVRFMLIIRKCGQWWSRHGYWCSLWLRPSEGIVQDLCKSLSKTNTHKTDVIPAEEGIHFLEQQTIE